MGVNVMAGVGGQGSGLAAEAGWAGAALILGC